ENSKKAALEAKLKQIEIAVVLRRITWAIKAARASKFTQVIRTVPHKVYNVAFTVGEAKNNCHRSTMVKAFAAKGTVKTPFKSEGTRNFKTFNFQFKAILYRTRLTFFSSFYHTRTNNYGTHFGPVLDEVMVFPAA
ncbi:Hypothetical predicted protein, partial [Olea europaea subsp. europaea]